MHTFIAITITVVSMYTAYSLRRNNSKFSPKLFFLTIVCLLITLAWACYHLSPKGFTEDNPWVFCPGIGTGLLIVQFLICKMKEYREILDSKAQESNFPRNELTFIIWLINIFSWFMFMNVILSSGLFIINFFN